MVAAPLPNFRGDLKISDQNNWGGGGPEKNIKSGLSLKPNFKKFSLTGPQLLEGGCWERGMHTMSVIDQRVKVSVAIPTDLNLLPYQTVIIQWRNFNKDLHKL